MITKLPTALLDKVSDLAPEPTAAIATPGVSTEVARADHVHKTGNSATGGGTNKVFYENDQAVTADYTVPVGKNAMSAGRIEVETGIRVTVSDGSRWVIV